MISEILCVGNELLSGITLNTNAYWIAAQVAGAGGTVRRVTVVGDDLGEISCAVRESLARKPEILVITGGLGATYDDMTLEGVAIALGTKLVLDDRAVEMLKKSYERRRRRHLPAAKNNNNNKEEYFELNEVRLKMATIPAGSTPIQNPVGTAPAIMVESGMTKIFCLPGVPSEMKAIFQEHVLPVVKESVGKFIAHEVNYNVRGVTEAMIAPALVKIVNANPKHAVYLKTHPRGYYRNKIPQIRIQLISRGRNAGDVRKRLDSIAKEIKKEVARLGGKISLVT